MREERQLKREEVLEGADDNDAEVAGQTVTLGKKRGRKQQ